MASSRINAGCSEDEDEDEDGIGFSGSWSGTGPRPDGGAQEPVREPEPHRGRTLGPSRPLLEEAMCGCPHAL